MTLKTIKSKVKCHQERGIPKFRDGTKCDEKTINTVKNYLSTREQESLLIIKRSVPIFTAISWFKRYFALVGDQMPNTENEIHLEACDYKDLYDEYEFDMLYVNKVDEYLAYKNWREVWTTHFPNVRVREYKQVSGKCNECEMLSDTRKKLKAAELRQLVTECHAFHRYY